MAQPVTVPLTASLATSSSLCSRGEHGEDVQGSKEKRQQGLGAFDLAVNCRKPLTPHPGLQSLLGRLVLQRIEDSH